jgi:hypothetical protein
MAITPQQAARITGAQEKAEARKLEKMIDAQLRKEYVPGERVCVDVGGYFGDSYLGERTVREIKRIYENAGWNVKYESDQRDGSWFEFTVRSEGGVR